MRKVLFRKYLKNETDCIDIVIKKDIIFVN